MIRAIFSILALCLAGFIGYQIAVFDRNDGIFATQHSQAIHGKSRPVTRQVDIPDAVAPVDAPSAPVMPPTPVILQVSAPELFRAYHNNEISADEYYKGQTLEVRGQVIEIRKDFTDKAILELGTMSRFETVDAYLGDASVLRAGTLAPGQVVTLMCHGAGMVVGSPVLKECSIE